MADPLGEWRDAVLRRDGYHCQLSDGSCAGILAAHHVIFRSRDSSRRADVDNGATLCRAHHDWVHAHPEEARNLGLAGRYADVVVRGRVVDDTDNTLSGLAALLAQARKKATP